MLKKGTLLHETFLRVEKIEPGFAKNTNFAIPTLPTDWFETVDWSTAANQHCCRYFPVLYRPACRASTHYPWTK
jgi:hypothetical protein